MMRTLAGLAALAARRHWFRQRPSRPRPTPRRAPSPGFSDTAETVMGTLTAPPSRRFLTRDSQREDGRRRAPRQRLAHAPHRRDRHDRAAAGRVHARRAAPDRRRPGGRDRQAARLGASDRGARRDDEPGRRARQAAGAAAALHSVGIDIDFAPVVDTPGSAGNFLGSRVFSRSRTWNAQMAHAFVGGLQANGDRGDREALPRPRPRERQHRQRTDRDPGRRLEAPPRDCSRSRAPSGPA